MIHKTFTISREGILKQRIRELEELIESATKELSRARLLLKLDQMPYKKKEGSR